MSQREQAKALVGQWVRFAHLPQTTHPMPIRVIASTSNGMVQLEGRSGHYAPKLFVVVKPPAEQIKAILRRDTA